MKTIGTHNYFVYILANSFRNVIYVGVTNDLERRIGEHNNGENTLAYTYKRRPVVLRYQLRFQDIKQAIAWEKQIKGWSRKKKEALFIEDWSAIKILAKFH